MKTGTDPLLIVGLGIAGAVLAWRLRELGERFRVIDGGDPNGATRVAPGIINPLAGKRLKPSWRVSEQLPEAMRVYRAIGQAIGEECFHAMPIIRVIKDAEQLGYLELRRNDPLAASYIGEEHPAGTLGGAVRDPFGSFVARGSGYLDGARLIAGMRRTLVTEGLLMDGHLDISDLEEGADGVRFRGVRYRAVIFCEGYRGGENPFFDTVVFKAAKGEMLELEADTERLPQAILNRGKWVLPAAPGRLRAGASYSWDPLDTVPTEEARAQILEILAEFIDLEFKVVGQSAGVRPIVSDYRPVLGRHPEHPAMVMFNGLGSKGVLSAPWLAGLLCDHLIIGRELPKEIRVERFIKR